MKRYWLLFVTLCIAGCSVVPVLESPRIRTGVKLKTVATYTPHEVHWSLSDSTMRNGVMVKDDYSDFGYEPGDVTPHITFALADRVEFGGYFWWILLNKGWDGRIKVSFFETGRPVLFRNIAVAVIAGSKGFDGEWDHTIRHWGGFTLGTNWLLSGFEMEYILMLTGGRDWYENSDGIGKADLAFSDAMLTTGVTANIHQRVFFSIALSTKKAFSKNIQITNYNGEETRITSVRLYQEVPNVSFFVGYRFGRGKWTRE